MKSIKELEEIYINQQIMYQKWFKEMQEEINELRKYCQEDKIIIDKLKARIEGEKK